MNTTTESGGGNRRQRATKYGLPTTKGDSLTHNGTKKTTQHKALANKSYPKYGGSALPKFKPVSDEITNYGAKKFRTPYRKDQFSGRTGSPMKVVILDIDGTLQGWGQSGDKDVMKWVKKHYDKGHLLVVVTARDDGMYDTSFNWLMRNLPFPFIGPFTRSSDDPRYASEFKRELCQGFVDSGMWEIVGAADDNEFVIKMWEKWAQEHPVAKDAEPFDLLKCDTYADYGGWRHGLSSKGNGLYDDWYGTGSYSTPNGKGYSSSTSHKGEHWVNGYNDPVTKQWVKGHYEKDVPTPPAATTSSPWRKEDRTVVTGGEALDISMDPRWQHYLACRVKAGAYLSEAKAEPEVIEGEVVDIIDEIEADRFGNGLRRRDLLAIVGYEYPGYESEELEKMGDDELCELAGLTANTVVSDPRWDAHVYAGDDDPLFEDWQLVPDGEDIAPDERDLLILDRLEMEENVYANDFSLIKADFVDMSYDDLFGRWVAITEQLERADVQPPQFSSAPDEAQTQPLDVGEVLS